MVTFSPSGITPLLFARQACVKNPANHVLIKSFDLTVLPGQTWALLGENGVGKSCLLRLLAGLSDHADHAINVLGHTLTEKPALLAKLRAYLPQQPDYPVEQTVYETLINARFPHQAFWQFFDSDVDKQLVLETAMRFFLEKRLHDRISTLSGGQFQRLALAAVWIQQAPLLLLDEPTSCLDLACQHQLLSLMIHDTKARQQAIIMALQDPNLARQYCTHAILLFPDGAYLTGTIEEMLTVTHLSALYQYPIQLAYTDSSVPYFISEPFCPKKDA